MRYSVSNFITVNGRRKAVVTVSNGEQSKELFVEVPAEMQEIAGTYEGEFRLWQREKDGKVFNNVAFHGEQVLVEAAKSASVDDIFAAFAAPATQAPAAAAPIDFGSHTAAGKDKARKGSSSTPDL